MTRQLTTINPATEEVIYTYEIMTKEQINEKTKKAQKAFSEWKIRYPAKVSEILNTFYQLQAKTGEL